MHNATSSKWSNRARDFWPGLERNSHQRLAASVRWAYLIFAISVIGLMMSTLVWPPNSDVAKMELIAREIARGRRPYADLVDMNWPGTHLVNLAGQIIFGSSYLAIRVRDLLLMVLVMTGVWKFLRPVGAVAAAIGLFLVPWWYYAAYGNWPNHERDWLIAAAVLWAGYLLTQPDRTWKVLGAGVLMGFATMIRPTALISAVVLLMFPLLGRQEAAPADSAKSLRGRARRLARPAVLYGSAAFCTAAGILLWVVQAGGWDAFVWLNTKYLPLYATLDAKGLPIDGGFEMLKVALSTFLHKPPELLPWTLAILVLLFRRRPWEIQLRVIALAALAASGLVAGLLTNKDWAYHFFMFYLPALMLLSVGFDDLHRARTSTWLRGRLGWVVVAVGVALVATVLLNFSHTYFKFKLSGNPVLANFSAIPSYFVSLRIPIGVLVPAMAALALVDGDIAKALGRRVDGDRPDGATQFRIVVISFCLIASTSAFFIALKSNEVRDKHDTRVASVLSAITAETTPEQSVLVMDTAQDGISSALMLADRPLSTKYVYDFYFFQNLNPTIMSMRASLMAQLRADPPELVVIANRSWGLRKDLASIGDFPELASFLEDNYRLVRFECLVTVLRLSPPGAGNGAEPSAISAAAHKQATECKAP